MRLCLGEVNSTIHDGPSKEKGSSFLTLKVWAQAMSEQRQRDSAAMVESLGTELAERNTVIAHLEEELQQKEHLLQQISVAAAPAAATLPVAPSPKRPAPAKMARIPHTAPQRMLENPSMLYPAQQALVSMCFPLQLSTCNSGKAPPWAMSELYMTDLQMMFAEC